MFLFGGPLSRVDDVVNTLPAADMVMVLGCAAGAVGGDDILLNGLFRHGCYRPIARWAGVIVATQNWEWLKRILSHHQYSLIDGKATISSGTGTGIPKMSTEESST
jgi:hypothetical protein